MPHPDLTVVLNFSNTLAWEDWLTLNAENSSGVWLRIGKAGKNSGAISIGDAGDAALCFGWIDSHRRSLDEVSFLQRYSPRRAGSPWSLVNVQRAERLTKAGRMRLGGQKEIDTARADGRWEGAYEPQRDAAVPEDFSEALAGNAEARGAFEGLGKTARYALLLPILKARTVAIRQARIGKAMEKLGGPTGLGGPLR